MFAKSRAVMLGLGLSSMVFIAGCAPDSSQYAADAYGTDQVNSQQEVKQIRILTVLPAKVVIDNSSNKTTAQVVGAILGAVAGGVAGHSLGSGRSDLGAAAGAASGGALGTVAGGLVNGKKLADGVTITFKDPTTRKVFSSTQVGRTCQFVPGDATMVSTTTGETRIQANATCPSK